MIGMLDGQRTYWQFAEPRLTGGAFEFCAQNIPLKPKRDLSRPPAPVPLLERLLSWDCESPGRSEY
jgi:hypothetical protein